MNILASYNWIKEFLETSLSPEEFSAELSLRSMSVESIENIAAKLDKIIVGRVLSVAKHPKADRLNVAQVDVGTGSPLNIVCGGTNLRDNMLVAVATVGAKVVHGKDEMVIQDSVIRDVPSQGMLCGAEEIGFGALATGPRDLWDLETAIPEAIPGTPLATALGLNDSLFDIEVTTNRPDAKSIIGLAREAGASLRAPFSSPAVPSITSGAGKPFSVMVDDPKRCLRQMAVVIDGIKVAPSPWWLQKRLLISGIRPINNIVDITNYVMLEWGQPLHAFDYAKLDGQTLVVRSSRAGESLLALNGTNYELSGQLVLADATKPLDVAGIMGGENTGTIESTTTIVVTASCFEPVSIRRAARSLNLYSDAQLLFEKGLSIDLPPIALARAVELILQIAGGQVASPVFDESIEHKARKAYPVNGKKIRERIGHFISDDEISDILNRLGFTLETSGRSIRATAPWWRDHDIEAEVDLTEEVARIYGYHRLPLQLPSGTPPTTSDDPSLVWEGITKRSLMSLGLTEFFGLSFIDKPTLEKAGISPEQAFSVYNPLNEDLSHLRPQLLPSLLRDISRNQETVPAAKVFELSRIHIPVKGNLPKEELALIMAIYGQDDLEFAYRQLRGVIEELSRDWGIALEFVSSSETDSNWEAKACADLVITLPDGAKKSLGKIGVINQNLTTAFGLAKSVVAASLNFEELVPFLKLSKVFKPLSAFPEPVRDLALLVSDNTTFESIFAVCAHSSPFLRQIELLETYRGSGIPTGHKSITLRLTLGAPDRTLTSEEINAAIDSISGLLSRQLQVTVR